jgi:hypothetical protein
VHHKSLKLFSTIQAIKEMTRICKKGGQIIITAPFTSGLHQEPHHYYAGFSPHFYNYVAKKYDLTVKVKGPTAAVAMDLTGSDVCLRSFPLNAVCKSCTVTVNNNSKTLQNHQ